MRISREISILAVSLFVLPVQAGIIDRFEDLVPGKPPVCKLDNLSMCNGTTRPLGSSTTAIIAEQNLKGTISSDRTTFLAIRSRDSSADEVHMHLTPGLGLIYTSTAGADGDFSLFYGAPRPFDANFVDAENLRLVVGSFNSDDKPIPLSVKLILVDENFKSADLTQTASFVFDATKSEEVLEFPLESFTRDVGFDLAHITFIQLDVDPGKARSFRLAAFDSSGLITPILGGTDIPTFSDVAYLLLVVLLSALGYREANRTRTKRFVNGQST